jgi:hypothetical protein
MKKLLFVLIASIAMITVSNTVKAQTPTNYTTSPSTKDSVVNTDSVTINFGAVTNNVVSLSFKGTRQSGTISSTSAKLYARVNDAFDWELVSTTSIPNGATFQGTFAIPIRTVYAKYIIRIVSGCTCELEDISGVKLTR